MKRIILLSLISFGYLTGFTQVTIEDCYRKAQANYPLIKQYDLIEKTKEYNLSNANKGYLPQIMFSGKATYQSDVTQLPIDFSQMGIQGVNIPALSKDQYGATIDVNQTIWDGGAIESQKESTRTASEVEKKNNKVNIYSINERVNQLYFGILLADAQIRQNQLLQDDLKRNYDQVQSYVQNGIANQADLDAIKIEQLKAEQNKTRFVNTKKAYTEMLSKLIGEEINVNTKFVKPDAMRPSTRTINRPELDLFDAQIKNLETKNREIDAGLMPKLGLFATGGYGKPGLNMLENDFSAYYIVGAKISWNIGNFYTKKNRKRQVQNNIRLVETQRETFLFNTNLDIVQKDNNINSYLEQLKYDDEIIALRGSVKRASEAKIANGTLSGSDLTRDINAEQMAVQDKILHEMEQMGFNIVLYANAPLKAAVKGAQKQHNINGVFEADAQRRNAFLVCEHRVKERLVLGNGRGRFHAELLQPVRAYVHAVVGHILGMAHPVESEDFAVIAFHDLLLRRLLTLRQRRRDPGPPDKL